ncbi:MAG: hypothetical protein ACXAEN_17070 [Candidatus Thorarchaeota archaeon]|jgi:hypothetical protein
MYNSTRSIFPAYSGIGEIKVSLPAPPSRSSIARDVEDLWNIRNSEPHIEVLEDPGVISPLPDNGFNPETDLTETSDANILANRGSKYLSSQKKAELLETLEDLYTQNLVSNLALTASGAGRIKAKMNEECPGSLLVYNGSDCDSLIKAYTLIRSLEQLIDKVVDDATFVETAKSEMIEFVKPCAAVRDALLLPNHMIRQKLFGSTESRDKLNRALSLFKLHEDDLQDIRINGSDSEYADYEEAIVLAELDLENAANKEICQGIVARAVDNATAQVVSNIGSIELRNAIASTLNEAKLLAHNECVKGNKGLRAMLGKLRNDLQQIGVNPDYLDALRRKEAQAERSARLLRKDVPQIQPNIRGSRRAHDELKRLPNQLAQVCQQLQHMSAQRLSPDARLATNAELYTLLCAKDATMGLARSQNVLKECARRLHEALLAEVKQSPKLRKLQNAVVSAKSDLKSAQVSKTMEQLEQAQSENAISDKKLQTLRTLLR